MSFSSSEWTYLLTTRIVAGNDSAFSFVRLKYGSNPTDTVSGVIIYPDDFTFSEAGVGAMNFGAYPVTQIDAVTWEALEDVGCVFLPFQSSVRVNNEVPELTAVEKTGMLATYISSQAANAQNAYGVDLGLVGSTWQLVISNNNQRRNRYHVRLAQDL